MWAPAVRAQALPWGPVGWGQRLPTTRVTPELAGRAGLLEEQALEDFHGEGHESGLCWRHSPVLSTVPGLLHPGATTLTCPGEACWDFLSCLLLLLPAALRHMNQGAGHSCFCF